MRKQHEFRPLIPRATVLLLGLAAVIFVAQILRRQAREALPPNLLLITVDTLRADELGVYGSSLQNTPNLDRLTREADIYQMPIAPSPWTLPSIASIMTGMEPKHHGAIYFQRALPQKVSTLAQILKRKGYSTSGAVTHFLLGPHYGFDRGFERFDPALIPKGDEQAHLSVTSQQLSDLGIEMMRTTKEPYFIWLHYFDPHFHYVPHAPYTPEGSEPGPGGQNFYRGEIQFTDQALGKLFSAADELARPPVVLFTADHGEQFYEHGGYQHTTAVYQEVAMVPLLVRHRGQKPQIIPGAKRTVDLHKMVLDLAGLRLGEDPFEPAVLIHTEQAANIRATVAGHYKLIVDLNKKKLELFNLAADPAEKKNLADQEPEVLKRLCTSMSSHFKLLEQAGEHITATETDVSAEQEEQFENLGYTTGMNPISGPIPDLCAMETAVTSSTPPAQGSDPGHTDGLAPAGSGTEAGHSDGPAAPSPSAEAGTAGGAASPVPGTP